MRDRDAYEAHGRNNPLSPEQLREHPYDFVALPDAPSRGQAVGHDRYPSDRLTGTLRLIYVTRTPLHVGSGVFETARECGLGQSTTPVRGIVRRQGVPILPGSSWKGAVRARYEAVTRSRLGLVDTRAREPAFKVPEVLRDEAGHVRSYNVKIEDPRVSALTGRGTVRSDALGSLSPAEALFGCMGYRGRLHPLDAAIEAPRPAEPLRIAPLDSPVPHRLARPGAARRRGHGEIVISEVEGRKFYYDGPIVSTRSAERVEGPGYEWIDHVPADAVITFDVHLETLTRAELGALLVSAGYGDGVGIVRFGGFKPAGLGKVDLQRVTVTAGTGSGARSWRRAESSPVDAQAVVKAAFDDGLIDTKALDELHQVTTRRRPE